MERDQLTIAVSRQSLRCMGHLFLHICRFIASFCLALTVLPTNAVEPQRTVPIAQSENVKGTALEKCACKNLRSVQLEIKDGLYLMQRYQEKADHYRQFNRQDNNNSPNNPEREARFDEYAAWVDELKSVDFPRDRGRVPFSVGRRKDDGTKTDDAGLKKSEKESACLEIHKATVAHEDAHDEKQAKVFKSGIIQSAGQVAAEEVLHYGIGLSALRKIESELKSRCNIRAHFTGPSLVAKGPRGGTVTLSYEGDICGRADSDSISARMVEHRLNQYAGFSSSSKMNLGRRCFVKGGSGALQQETASLGLSSYVMCLYSPEPNAGEPRKPLTRSTKDTLADFEKALLTIRSPSGIYSPDNIIDPKESTVAIDVEYVEECPIETHNSQP